MAGRKPIVWGGWIYFAAVMLTIAGGLQMIAGLTGIFSPNFYVVVPSGELLALDYTSRGIIQLVIGVGAIIAAIGLILDTSWAQKAGVVVSICIGIVSLLFVEAYPLWSIVSLIIIGIVIYAITLHGDELKN